LATGHKVRIFTNKLDRKICFQEILNLPIEVVSPEKSLVGSIFRRNPFRRAIDYYWNKTRLALETSERVEDFSPDIVIFEYTGEHWLYPYFYYIRNSTVAATLNVLPPAAVANEPPAYQLYHYAGQQAPTWRRLLSEFPNYLPPISYWEAKSLGKLDVIVTHSKFVAEKISHHKLSKSKQTRVVPLGVDHSRFFPTWEEEPYLLLLGRIHPCKNIELSLQSLRDIPTHVRLVIAGDIEPRFQWYEQKLQRLANDMNLSDRVEIRPHPSQEEVVELMQKCLLFLFPSLVDTFGMVVLEAMACGKPVVASKAGGVPELIGECGFTLKPDPKDWVTIIKKLLADNDMRKQFGKKAFERSKSFTWDVVSNSMINALQTAVNEKC
jgi:glycosyltransferase involved in cell wall biosynthesis